MMTLTIIVCQGPIIVKHFNFMLWNFHAILVLKYFMMKITYTHVCISLLSCFNEFWIWKTFNLQISAKIMVSQINHLNLGVTISAKCFALRPNKSNKGDWPAYRMQTNELSDDYVPLSNFCQHILLAFAFKATKCNDFMFPDHMILHMLILVYLQCRPCQYRVANKASIFRMCIF